jgi:hypothetical protein
MQAHPNHGIMRAEIWCCRLETVVDELNPQTVLLKPHAPALKFVADGLIL